MGSTDDDDDDHESDLVASRPARIWGFWKKIPISLSDAEARRVLREHNGLVQMFMRRYQIPDGYTGFDRDDLHAVGQIVLLQAYTSFDPEKGAFSTWASRLLQQSFLDIARRTRGQTRRQQADYVALREWKRWLNAVQHVGERAAGPAPELPSTQRVVSVEAALGRRTVPLDEHPGDDFDARRGAQDDLHEVTERKQLMAWIRQRIATGLLTEQERRVVAGVLEDANQQEIADSLGVTRQRVQQIYAIAIEKLRQAAKRDRVVR